MLVSVQYGGDFFLPDVGLSLALTSVVIRVLDGLSPGVGGAVVPFSFAIPASVGSPVLFSFIGVLVWTFKGAMIRSGAPEAQVMALV